MNDRMRDAFRQFARNERWGTCAECPRDSEGHAYPEFCPNTDRCDHNFSEGTLIESYRNEQEFDD